MLFKSKKSEPQEVAGAALEDEYRELSDDVLDTIYGGDKVLQWVPVLMILVLVQ